MLKRKTRNETYSQPKLKKHKANSLQKEQSSIFKHLTKPDLPTSESPPTYSLHPQIRSTLMSYLKSYRAKVQSKDSFVLKEPKKTFVVQGPPGCGKTFLIRDTCAYMGFKLLELNVSCQRNSSNINKLLKEATQTYTLGQNSNIGAVVFIDDIELHLEPDVGFYKCINDLVTKSRSPILMACTWIPPLLQSNKDLKVFTVEAPQLEKILHLTPKVPEYLVSSLYRIYKGNLHRILNTLSLCQSGQNNFGQAVELKATNTGVVLVQNQTFQVPLELMELNSLCLDTDLDITSEWLDLLCTGQFSESLSGFFKDHYNEDPLEFHGVQNFPYKEQTREHLLHFGDVQDHITFFEWVRNKSAKQFTTTLRNSKKQNLLELFLKRNPNMFR